MTTIDYLLNNYPDLSPLEIHYLCMKHHGVKDKLTLKGRPSWNLFDDKNIYHITFGTSEYDSPYTIKKDTLSWDDGDLPFEINFVERVPVVHGRYYYFRHTDFLTPSLDDKLILNLNFQRQCQICDFCQFQLYNDKPNISVKKGFELILKRGDMDSFENISEIAIVTGLFGTSELVTRHILEIIEYANRLGFQGSIFYMGFELDNNQDVKKIVSTVGQKGLKEFRIAYTLESFTRRKELIHGKKGNKSILDIEKTLIMLKLEGVKSIQYAYIPGLDSLDDFYKYSERFRDLAEPHICIFRPWKKNQRKSQVNPNYLVLGPEYLIKMRLHFENLYNGPILGNNLANFWAFPKNRISEKWFSHEIVGPIIGRRWWRGSEDLRNKDTQLLDLTGGK